MFYLEVLALKIVSIFLRLKKEKTKSLDNRMGSNSSKFFYGTLSFLKWEKVWNIGSNFKTFIKDQN